MIQRQLDIRTGGRDTTDITSDVAEVVSAAGLEGSLCHVFITHTSAALMLCENADPDVRTDLETFMRDLVPDGDARFVHTAEGPDDMSAHVRSVLTHSDLTIPVINGRLGLGTWQGIYVWEHRAAPHTRRIIVTVR